MKRHFSNSQTVSATGSSEGQGLKTSWVLGVAVAVAVIEIQGGVLGLPTFPHAATA
jgi:hypothetical protein